MAAYGSPSFNGPGLGLFLEFPPGSFRQQVEFHRNGSAKMVVIRQAVPGDLDAFYRISVLTGHLGADARHLYSDHRLMGHIYSAPYLVLEPELALALEVGGAVLGFCVGTADTQGFEERKEQAWWPALRQDYRKPHADKKSAWSADERRAQMIHEPVITPEEASKRFPAHLHLNLLPEVQGQGFGATLFETWKRRAEAHGMAAVHVGANANNRRAIAFWQKLGFEVLDGAWWDATPGTVWLGLQLARDF